MLTPPLHASISVPFQWEEAPGKPRSSGVVEPNSSSKPKSVRSLDLPPRLFTDAKVAHFASPTTAVNNSTADPDLSSSLSFRFPDTWAETVTAAAREGKDGKYGGSRRWMSFRKNKGNPKGGSEISLSVGGADGGGDGDGDGHTRVKITRFRSRRSFFGTSKSKSQLIVSLLLQLFLPKLILHFQIFSPIFSFLTKEEDSTRIISSFWRVCVHLDYSQQIRRQNS